MELDALAAKRIGAAVIACVWNFGQAPAPEVTAIRKGHVWVVTRDASKMDLPKSEDVIVEPLTVALDAQTGQIVGGALSGPQTTLENLLHRVYRASTANGLDATSTLQGSWAKILARAVPAKPDRSPTMLAVEEMLGPKWTVGLSGRATSGGTTVRLRLADAAFLRALAAVRPLKGS